MALHYLLVFGLLIFESAVFLTLIIPLPNSLRSKVLIAVSQSPLVARFLYWLRVAFIFVGILFVDAVNRMVQANREHAEMVGVDARDASQYYVKKFYSQRNVYLTGFTLFLGLILSSTYTILLDLVKCKEALESARRQSSEGSKKYAEYEHENEGLKETVTELQKELDDARKKVVDFDHVKKQAENQHREYMRLADQYNELEKRLERQQAEERKDA